MQLRHQLASYSPVSIASAGYATLDALSNNDPRFKLVEVLKQEYFAGDALLCGSGTQALQLAIVRAMRDVTKHESLALPAFGCFDLASAAIGADVPVSLYDIDPDTLSPDPDSLSRAFSQGARVAVIAPLYGVPVDWESLEASAAQHGARLIEDAALGHGASWRGRKLGSLGRVSTLSFGRGKGWTGGRGGALLVRHGEENAPEQLENCALGDEMENVAALVAQAVLGRPEIYGVPHSIPLIGLGETRYRPPSAPTKMPRTAAAAALNSKTRAGAEAELRRQNARWVLERLPTGRAASPIAILDQAIPGFLRLPIRLRKGMSSFKDPSRALRLGIAPSYPAGLGELTQLIARLNRTERRWPGAEALVRELVTLPTHSLVARSEREGFVPMLEETR